MKWAVATIQAAMENPLTIDSADPLVLEAGLSQQKGKPFMINSIKADEGILQEVLPLAERHRATLVALAMDGGGIPSSVGERLRACEKIADACARQGIQLARLFFDPLVMPIGTDVTQAMITLETIREINNHFPGAKTVLGVSNISYGLPARSRLNSAFLSMAIYAGIDAALIDPLDRELLDAMRAAEVLVGRDRHCRRYTRAFRKARGGGKTGR